MDGFTRTYIYNETSIWNALLAPCLSSPEHAPSPAPAIPSPILAVVFAGEPRRRPRWPLAKPQLAAAVVRWCRAAAAVAAALGDESQCVATWLAAARAATRAHPRSAAAGCHHAAADCVSAGPVSVCAHAVCAPARDHSVSCTTRPKGKAWNVCVMPCSLEAGGARCKKVSN